MYGFCVRRGKKKVAVVERWPLAEVRLYLHQLSIDIIMIVSPRVFLPLRFTTTVHTKVKKQKWKHRVRKWQTMHCTPSILITGGSEK